MGVGVGAEIVAVVVNKLPCHVMPAVVKVKLLWDLVWVGGGNERTGACDFMTRLSHHKISDLIHEWQQISSTTPFFFFWVRVCSRSSSKLHNLILLSFVWCCYGALMFLLLQFDLDIRTYLLMISINSRIESYHYNKIEKHHVSK